MPEVLPLFDFDQLKPTPPIDFSGAKDYIWFKVDDQNDYWLVYLSKKMEFDKLNFGFKYLTKNILLLGPSQDQVDQLSTGGFQDLGGMMYWQLSNSPDWLQTFSQFVSPYFTSGQVFLNISQTEGIYRLKIFEQLSDSGQQASDDLANIRLPKNQGLIFAFNQNHASSSSQFIQQNILDPFFSSLPASNVVFKSPDGWIFIYKKDLKPRLSDFSHNLEVEEVVKTLPDGSSYIELVAKADQSPSDLYNAELDKYYYLSNSQILIDQIHNNYRLVGDLCISCQDFMQIKTDLLPESTLKNYLNSQNIKDLSAFSYQDSQTQGFELYFE